MSILKHVVRVSAATAGAIVALALLLPHLVSQGYLRSILADRIDSATGASLEISGHIRPRLIPELGLEASHLELKGPDDAYSLELDRIDLDIELIPALRGDWVMRDVTLTGLDLRINANALPRPTQTSTPTTPSVELRSASVRKSAVTLQWQQDRPPLRIDIGALTIAQSTGSEPALNLSGDLTVDRHAVTVTARTGTLFQALNPVEPYPVDLTVEAPDLARAHISGTIADPVNGQGLNLALAANADASEHLLSLLLGEALPPTGKLTLESTVDGPVDAPRVSSMSLALVRGQDIDVRITGRVDNAMTVGGTAMKIDAQVESAEVLKALLPDSFPNIERFDARGDLRKADADSPLQLSAVEAQALTSDRLHITLEGSTDLSLADPLQPFPNLDAPVRFRSPTTDAAKVFLPDAVPEIGPVVGRVRLAGGDGALAVEDIDVHIGNADAVEAHVSGRIGRMVLDENTPDSELDLDIAIRAPGTETLARAFGEDWPELGAVSLSGKFAGSRLASTLTGLALAVGSPRSLHIRADGQINLGDLEQENPIRELSIDLAGRAPSTAAAAPLLGSGLPPLGPLSVTATLAKAEEQLSARDVVVQWGQEATLSLKGKGTVARVSVSGDSPTLDGIDLSVSARSAGTHALGTLFKQDAVPELGPVSGTFRVRGSDAQINLSELKLNAGRRSGVTLRATGAVKSIPLSAHPRISGLAVDLHAETITTRALGTLLDWKLPELGPGRGSARLRETRSGLGLDAIQFRLGPARQPAVSGSGYINDLHNLDSFAFSVALDVPYAAILPPKAASSVTAAGRIRGNAKLSREKGVFGSEKFTIASHQTRGHRFSVHGSLLDVKGLNGLNAVIDFHVDDASTIGLFFGERWPSLPAASGAGRLEGDQGKATYDGHLKYGQSHATVQARLETGEERPLLDGHINVPRLFLADLGLQGEAEALPPAQSGKPRYRAQQEPEKPLFSRDPFDLEALQAVDADVQVSVDEIIGIREQVGNIKATLSLRDGLLKIDPARLNFLKGELSFSASADSRQAHDQFSIDLAAKHLDVGTFIAEITGDPQNAGKLQMSTKLNGSGTSPHAVAASANGEMSFILEGMRIPGTKLDLLLGNYLGWAIDTTTKKQAYSELYCTVISFNVVDGDARSKVVYAEGPHMAVRGKVDINLADETIKATILPKQKKKFWVTASPVKLSGPIQNPKISVISAQTAISTVGNIGGLVLAPTIYLPIRILDYLTDSKDEGDPSDKTYKACIRTAFEKPK